MKKNWWIILSLCTVFAVTHAEETEEPTVDESTFDFEIPAGTTVEAEATPRPFDVYGYIINLANMNFSFAEDGLDTTDFGFVSYVRIKAEWKPGPDLTFHTEISWDAKTGNQNPWIVFESYGMSPPDDFIRSISVDHYWGSVNLAFCDVRFGKLPIAWGAGYVFNPTAKVAPVLFLDTVAEETPGTLGIVPSLSMTERLALEGYVAFEDRTHKTTALAGDADWNNLPWGIRLQAVIGPFDASISLIKEVVYAQAAAGYARAHYIGFDFAGAIWDFGVYGEAAFELPRISDGAIDLDGRDPADLVELCVGFDYTIPVFEVETRAEYYFQGKGESDPADYDVAAVFSGDLVLQAEHYLFVNIEKTLLDYFTIGTGVFFNLNDASAVILPNLNYDMDENFQVSLGAIVPFGPGGSEFNGAYTVPVDPGPPPVLADIDIMQPSVFLSCSLSF